MIMKRLVVVCCIICTITIILSPHFQTGIIIVSREDCIIPTDSCSREFNMSVMGCWPRVPVVCIIVPAVVILIVVLKAVIN